MGQLYSIMNKMDLIKSKFYDKKKINEKAPVAVFPSI